MQPGLVLALFFAFLLQASYYCVEFQGKLMNQTFEKSKNLVLGPILTPLLKFGSLKQLKIRKS